MAFFVPIKGTLPDVNTVSSAVAWYTIAKDYAGVGSDAACVHVEQGYISNPQSWYGLYSERTNDNVPGHFRA